MSSHQRSQAYGRVIRTVDDLAGAKLHSEEQAQVREAADALIFCEDMRADPAAEAALAGLYELTDRLVESERMLPETARQLVADVEACGPFAEAA